MAPWHDVIAGARQATPALSSDCDPSKRPVLWHLPDRDVLTYGPIGAQGAAAITMPDQDTVAHARALWSAISPGRTVRIRQQAASGRARRGPGRTGPAGRNRP